MKRDEIKEKAKKFLNNHRFNKKFNDTESAFYDIAKGRFIDFAVEFAESLNEEKEVSKESNTVSAEEFDKLFDKYEDTLTYRWSEFRKDVFELLKEYKENNNCISVENPPKQKQ